MSFFRIFAVFAAAVFFVAGCGSEHNAEELMNGAVQSMVNGDCEQALKLAVKAVKMAPGNADARIIAAVAAEKCGQRNQAIEDAAEAVKLAPSSFAAQYTLGRLYAADRTTGYDALIALGKALELRPGDRNTLILLVNVNMSLSPEQAQKHLLALARDRKLFDTAAYQNQLGICLVRRKMYKAAGNAFLKAYRTQPSEPVLLYNLALCMDQYLGNGKVALPLYRKYLDVVPEDDSSSAARRFAVSRVRAIGGR